MQADEVNFGMAIDRLNRRIASKDPRHWAAFKIVAARGAFMIVAARGAFMIVASSIEAKS